MFGDLEKCLDKFNTCARSRPYNEQILGHEFYCKEHTKPLFNKLRLLSFQNIYTYQVCLETLKILKFRTPNALYNRFAFSPRNNGIYLLTSRSTINFVYDFSKKWNTITKILAKPDSIHNIKIGSFKSNVKTCLLKIQGMFDKIEWYDKNFELASYIGSM